VSDNNPLYTTLEGFEIYKKLVKETKDIINNTDNPRIIVIQTWIIIDFCIRDTLITGLHLSDFIVEDLDLRYSLLPQRFDNCIELIKKIEKVQKKLKERSPDQYLGWSLTFLDFIKEYDPFFYSKLLEYEQNYYKKYHPECINEPGRIFIPNPEYNIVTNKKINYRSVDKDWLKSVEKITDDWIKKAKKINEVRNSAAHAYDHKIIYKKLGLKGNKKLLRLKSFCNNMLNDLLDFVSSQSA
jgi:hypothetical protein